MPAKKQTKTHTSTRKKAQTSARKKASALSATSSRSKKATSKAPTSKIKNKPGKGKLSERERQKLREMTLKMFQMVYDANQRGEFHRIL
jgi:hypothetical protein